MQASRSAVRSTSPADAASIIDRCSALRSSYPPGSRRSIREAIPGGVVEQLCERRGQPRPGGGHERRVKRRVGDVHPHLISGSDVVIHLRHKSFELCELFRPERGNGQPDRHCFERDAHGVESFEICDREVGDPDATIRLGDDAGPPRSSSRSASRSGVRLTPSCLASATWEVASPGAISPRRIASRRRSCAAITFWPSRPVTSTRLMVSDRLARLILNGYLDTVAYLVR